LPDLAQVVRCIMSAAGDKAATATDDHWVQIWDLPSGRLCFDVAVRWRSPFCGLARRFALIACRILVML
jgi:hypothetical protein